MSLLAEVAETRSFDSYEIYADSLQQRGDPRGELIALAVHAERTGAAPGDRQRELESRLAAELLGPTRGRVHWRCGFVDTLVIQPGKTTAWNRLAEAEACALLRGLEIESTRSVGNNWLASMRRSPLLAGLVRFASTNPSTPWSLVADVLEATPRLRELDVKATLPLELLEAHPRLERLTMPINTSELDRFGAGPWPLVALSLSLSGRSLDLPEPLVALARGDTFPLLRELALYPTPWAEQLVRELAAGPRAKRALRLGLVWQHVNPNVLRELRRSFDDLELVLDPWLRPGGDTHDAYYLSRAWRLGLGDGTRAIPYARRAAESMVRDPYRLRELGFALHGDQRYAEALAVFERVCELDPTDWTAYHYRATSLRGLRRYAEATEILDATPHDLSRRDYDHELRGELLADRDRLDEADACYREAIEQAPSDRKAYRWRALGALWLERGELARAGEACANARSLTTGADHWLDRQESYLAIRRGGANDVLTAARARALDPELSEDARIGWQFLIAEAAFATGDLAAAAAVCSTVSTTSTCPAWIGLAWLGEAVARARDPFGELVELEPAKLTDAIASITNQRRPPGAPIAHDTTTKPLDRLNTSIAVTAGHALAGRRDQARDVASALLDHLRTGDPARSTAWLPQWVMILRVCDLLPPSEAAWLWEFHRIATGRGDLP